MQWCIIIGFIIHMQNIKNELIKNISKTKKTMTTEILEAQQK